MVFDATQNRNGINNKLKPALDLGRSQISKLFLSLFCLRIFFIIFVFWFREVSDTLTISVTLSFSYFLWKVSDSPTISVTLFLRDWLCQLAVGSACNLNFSILYVLHGNKDLTLYFFQSSNCSWQIYFDKQWKINKLRMYGPTNGQKAPNLPLIDIKNFSFTSVGCIHTCKWLLSWGRYQIGDKLWRSFLSFDSP